ncbi:MAG TPA: hypothetical protein VJS92_16770, partial [Candidatus Polarisedimenticolaceae bacterium]|nr:hypothetical protein [Candidatus Polarisedimenticolaceae bacterium]
MRGTAAAVLSAALVAACAGPSGPGEAPVWTLRGHQELWLSADGTALPWVLGRAEPVGICAGLPAERDTSRWEARFLGDGAFHAPAARLGETLCFDAPLPAALEPGTRRLCAEVRDGYDGTIVAAPCLTLRFDAGEGALPGLRAELAALLARRTQPA